MTPGHRVVPHRRQARQALAPAGARGISAADTIQCLAARQRRFAPSLLGKPCHAFCRALSSKGCTAMTRGVSLCGGPIQKAGRWGTHGDAHLVHYPDSTWDLHKASELGEYLVKALWRNTGMH